MTDQLLIAQLTDTHVVGRDNTEDLYVDNNARLDNAVARINGEQPTIAAVIATGDLTNTTDPVTASTTLIDTDDGVKVGATYEATDEKIAKVDGFISEVGESAELRKTTYEESEGWYAGITADMFGAKA